MVIQRESIMHTSGLQDESFLVSATIIAASFSPSNRPQLIREPQTTSSNLERALETSFLWDLGPSIMCIGECPMLTRVYSKKKFSDSLVHRTTLSLTSAAFYRKNSPTERILDGKGSCTESFDCDDVGRNQWPQWESLN